MKSDKLISPEKNIFTGSLFYTVNAVDFTPNGEVIFFALPDGSFVPRNQ
jgi:hypothetical protein